MTQTFFLGLVYERLTGQSTSHVDILTLMRGVMAHWDATAFTAPTERTCAQLALCQIGLRWYPIDHHPFTFDDVVARFREVTPELGDAPVTSRTMQDMLFPRRHVVTSRQR